MPQRKRATIREVAKATGLSPAAVSYALRGMQVSEETQRRVRRAAAELGYEADPIARALASGRTGMIGVLCSSLEDLWQQSLAVGIGRTLREKDHYALILDAAGDPDRESTLARQLRGVDGLIVQPVDPAAAFWPALAESLPVVVIGDALKDARTAAEVVFDNHSGVTMALEYLRAMGHHRVAVLTPTQASTPDRPADRLVNDEAQRLGLNIEVLTCPQGLAPATEVARSLLSAAARPSAVFCFSDSIAYGVLMAANSLGLKVPGEVSVMGYDDHPMSELLGLTSVNWNLDGIVQAAVRLVLGAADGTIRRRRITQEPFLRDRTSVGAV
ncbi:LacI family transcriptional regulator [Acrocarpospora pleiomorpha]|uniref:LacI family transcriptional regulator n=1 Tax=Acrocarpospora pleiomorpha TaxID=90975 RepID=A0A5M3XIV6_9ACTN|nr:LacI family DNA-binding transcriptional regulator [Acrocarpospora pleiomorpha]GES21174.1 LacI family transcriptional regulator [Acrocarpospora pleiomorpha]